VLALPSQSQEWTRQSISAEELCNTQIEILDVRDFDVPEAALEDGVKLRQCMSMTTDKSGYRLVLILIYPNGDIKALRDSQGQYNLDEKISKYLESGRKQKITDIRLVPASKTPDGFISIHE
jgi:hypothetical protein